MGKKAYNHSKEPDRAKTLQKINDLINKECRDDVDSDNVNSGGGFCNADEVQLYSRKKRERYEDSEINEDSENNGDYIILKKKKMSSDEQLQEKHGGDWGKQHPFYDKLSQRIKWSPFEKNYIQEYVDKYPPHKHNVWRHCLDSILNTNDENIRQQFHVSHLELVKLKDAIRVKKKQN